ncbi:MAG TPA: isoprenylcysteine carboxylmethyltransferase family protein [Thermomicrobiales bacterium]|jgi:protein-S-isoprenylcysteine O-methyltransferase Ste14
MNAAIDQAPVVTARRLSRRRLGDYGLSFLLALFAMARTAALMPSARHGDTIAVVNGVAVAIAMWVSAFLPLLRKAPIAERPGWRPRAIATIGNFAIMPLAVLPLTWQPDWLLTLTTIGMVAAYCWVVWALVTLWRGFSVFPEARLLVTHGPYGIVRHPLYAAYALVYALVALPRFGLPALLIGTIGVAAEVMRAVNEEQVLQSVFPEYREYAARVPAFLPRTRRATTVSMPALPVTAEGEGPEDAIAA